MLRKGEARWLTAFVEIENCSARGQSCEEAPASIEEEIQVRMEDSLGDDKDIPQAEMVNFTTICCLYRSQICR